MKLKSFSEINPAFGVRTNNVQMFFDNYDDGLDIIGLESTGMELVSSKSPNYFQIVVLLNWIDTNVYFKVEKSEAIATFMSALVLDPKSKQFNYNHTAKSAPLKSRRLWEGRWSKITESSEGERSYQQIDLAKTIQAFYLNGNTNLSQCELISGTPNTFKFHKKK